MKRRGITLVFIAAALVILLLPAVAYGSDSSSRPFNDVPKNQWYYSDVYNAYNNGIFKGTSDHTFSPGDTVTRGMFVTVLHRQSGSPLIVADSIFSDVAQGAYYYNPVNWAVKNDIASGFPDGTFGPDEKLTREQVANMLFNYYSAHNLTTGSYSLNNEDYADAKLVSDWAKECMAWANEEGLIKGKEENGKTYLAPGEAVSRAEACAIINRYNVKYNGAVMEEYSDEVNFDSLAALDNTRKDYWFGSNYDSLNRPYETLRFQSEEGSRVNAVSIDANAGRKVIYLTFDEGYEAGYTSKILDVLSAKGVPAVFFITGYYYKTSKWLVSRMVNEGHVVGNHSNTHPENGMPSLSLQEQYQDIETLQNCMRNDFNYEMTLFRNPAGIYSEQSMALVEALHMKSVFWSFAYKDYDTSNQPSQSAALEKLKARLHPGAIYLLHAVSSTNANILGQFIDYARNQGYTFELVTNS